MLIHKLSERNRLREAQTNPFGTIIWPMGEMNQGRWPSVLETMQIAPRVPSALQLNQQLLFQHEETMTLARLHDLSIDFLGYAEVFEGTRLYRGGETDWALMSLAEDPHYANGQKLYLPPQAKSDIERINAAGLGDFVMYVAHELPKDSVAFGQSIPLELLAPPPPPRLVKRLQGQQWSLSYLWKAVAAGIKGVAVVGTASVAAAGVAAVAATAAVPIVAVGALAALANLDPILFGVHLDPSRTINGRPMGMWYYLTHWYWPEE